MRVICNYMCVHIYTVSQCKLHKLLLSELRQIFINFNNSWSVNDNTADVICHTTSSTSPRSSNHTTLLNTKVLNFTVSQKSCEKFSLSELRISSTFHRFYNL